MSAPLPTTAGDDRTAGTTHACHHVTSSPEDTGRLATRGGVPRHGPQLVPVESRRPAPVRTGLTGRAHRGTSHGGTGRKGYGAWFHRARLVARLH
jgi:hypothetical protein